MSRKANRLTAMTIRKSRTPGYYHDGAGLYLQVSPSLTKSWIYRYTRNGKTREMGLGTTNAFTLAEARKRARTQRKLVTDGADPIEVRDAMRRAQIPSMHLRRVGEFYDTPRGLAKWTGTGWLMATRKDVWPWLVE